MDFFQGYFEGEMSKFTPNKLFYRKFSVASRLEKPGKMGFSMPGNLANSQEISNTGRKIELSESMLSLF